jgi:Rad3-related DNA helicase
MDDRDILHRITNLVDEEHELRERHVGTELHDDDRARLAELERELDQCWDLLRQRRARREFGEDPDATSPRPADEVGDYRQ